MTASSVVYSTGTVDGIPVSVENSNIHQITGIADDRLEVSSCSFVCRLHAKCFPIAPVDTVAHDVQTKGMEKS